MMRFFRKEVVEIKSAYQTNSIDKIGAVCYDKYEAKQHHFERKERIA